MQIKEYEAYTLKECLQQVRDDLGPEAVILETRKVRKGGVLGLGAREAVCIVAAIGISVKEDVAAARRAASSSKALTGVTPARSPADNGIVSRARSVISADRESIADRNGNSPDARSLNKPGAHDRSDRDVRPDSATRPAAASVGQSAAVAAARNAYTRAGGSVPGGKDTASGRPSSSAAREDRSGSPAHVLRADNRNAIGQEEEATERRRTDVVSDARNASPPEATPSRLHLSASASQDRQDETRFTMLEQAMREIREGLSALQRDQQSSHERTISAVVSAVTPALNAATNAAHLAGLADADTPRFPEMFARLTDMGVTPTLAHELLDELPDFSAWSEEAQTPLAAAALRDLIARRVCSSGPITLTPGQLKAVALIGPTGVGKTTTIAKLAAHFALVEKKRVALLTMDTYRIAAVEQLKIYSQILDIPVGVAYSHAEVAPVIAQYADFDLLLIDTAGRSQKNIMQVGELKSLLEAVGCETHLVLSAQTKEQDMIESAQRFSAARVDRLIFSKLDETDSYGTLLNVADRTGIPLSYLTTGQKVPEDLELADGGRLAGLLLA